MKERFKQLPEPLQQQVIRRFAIAIVFVLLFFITLFGFWDVYLFLPCLLFAGFFIVKASGVVHHPEGSCRHLQARQGDNRQIHADAQLLAARTGRYGQDDGCKSHCCRTRSAVYEIHLLSQHGNLRLCRYDLPGFRGRIYGQCSAGC